MDVWVRVRVCVSVLVIQPQTLDVKENCCQWMNISNENFDLNTIEPIYTAIQYKSKKKQFKQLLYIRKSHWNDSMY